jgi:hypothetical protein
VKTRGMRREGREEGGRKGGREESERRTYFPWDTIACTWIHCLLTGQSIIHHCFLPLETVMKNFKSPLCVLEADGRTLLISNIRTCRKSIQGITSFTIVLDNKA